MHLNIVLLILAVLTQAIAIPIYEQLEGQLENIDNQIISHRRMWFLNQNFNNISKHFSGLSIFEQMKIRKYVTTKVDVGEEIAEILKAEGKYVNQIEGIQQFDVKERFLENMNLISTIGLPSKKFEGINYNSHIILQSYNKFYSLEGQNIFTFALSDRKDSAQQGKLMIASSRNENFYIARYWEQHSVRYNGECLNIKISQVEVRNKHFQINNKLPFCNLMIQTDACGKRDTTHINHYSPYEFFFTHNAYHNKPSHYILANGKQIHFYLYSEVAEQLVIDHNRTIKLASILYDNTSTISTIVKLNTHLIILTDQNHLLSLNLITHLSSQTQQPIITYETLPSKLEKLCSVHFTDHDFKYFYLLSNRNIYLYKLSTQKIVKKYPLQTPLCQSKHNNKKCTENIWILENYILLQQKQQRNQYKVDYSYFLIDKSFGNWHPFHIPFSHQSKCSSLKKIFLMKNKNSHYIITLACFMQQKAKNKDQTDHQVHTQASNYLILQHLNLQTSSEINTSGESGGVDFNKFRVPMIVFSIGLVCYITLKRSSKKSPQKIVEEQKLNKKFEQQILSTIRREKQRQQALDLHREKR